MLRRLPGDWAATAAISRVLQRNICAYDGAYRFTKAQRRTNGRRWRTRRGLQHTSAQYWCVEGLLAAEVLKRMGCQVDVVGNGSEAVTAYQQLPYDLIFMDCNMPVMDGFDATRQIRRLEGDRRHVPIIAMTASALQGDREKCLAAGMDDFISKPLRLQQLGQLVESCLPLR